MKRKLLKTFLIFILTTFFCVNSNLYAESPIFKPHPVCEAISLAAGNAVVYSLLGMSMATHWDALYALFGKKEWSEVLNKLMGGMKYGSIVSIIPTILYYLAPSPFPDADSDINNSTETSLYEEIVFGLNTPGFLATLSFCGFDL